MNFYIVFNLKNYAELLFMFPCYFILYEKEYILSFARSVYLSQTKKDADWLTFLAFLAQFTNFLDSDLMNSRQAYREQNSTITIVNFSYIFLWYWQQYIKNVAALYKMMFKRFLGVFLNSFQKIDISKKLCGQHIKFLQLLLQIVI